MKMLTVSQILKVNALDRELKKAGSALRDDDLPYPFYNCPDCGCYTNAKVRRCCTPKPAAPTAQEPK